MGGYPIPGVGGVPQLGLDGGGVPHLRSGVGGYPIPGLDGGGGTLSLGWGVPWPGLDGGGYPGYTLARSGWWGWYLGYASCVHALGLSCLNERFGRKRDVEILYVGLNKRTSLIYIHC